MKKIILFFLITSSLSPTFAQPSELLKQYRDKALQYNHSLKAAEKNITASLELEKSARANRMPQVGANANFKYTGNPMELTLNLPTLQNSVSFQGNHSSYGASVSILQPIYTGGEVLETIRLAQHQQSLANNQADAIRLAICYQTDIQYWSTVARHEVIRVATDFQHSIQTLVQTIRERVEAGLTDPQDLLMAEVKLNEANYQLLEAINNFRTGQMALNSIIGVELQTHLPIDSLIPVISSTDSLFQSQDNLRPEIRIAETQIKMAESNLKLKTSAYKPKLYIGMDGNYSSPGYNFHKDLDPNYAAYAKLSVPIFEWGKRRSEKRYSTQQIGIANDQLNQVKDDITLEVQNAQVGLQQAQEQVNLSGNSLEKAGENEQKALERYNEGKISLVEVINAQTYRQTAQLNYVQAKMTAQYQYAGLIRALGIYE